jgi:hypothetical protein
MSTRIGDNLSQSFYDVDSLTVHNKTEYVINFIMRAKVDVFGLQEISADMYEILRNRLEADICVSPKIQRSIIIAKKPTVGDLKPMEFNK